VLTQGGNRNMGTCQAAVAEAVAAWGRLDVLFCCESLGVCWIHCLSMDGMIYVWFRGRPC